MNEITNDETSPDEMQSLLASVGCPVCGYPNIEPFDEHGFGTFEICSSCGCEAGYEYDHNSTGEDIIALRKNWLFEQEGKWCGPIKRKPAEWDPIKQLKEASLRLPTKG